MVCARVSHPSNEALPVTGVVEQFHLLAGLDHEAVHVHVQIKEPGRRGVECIMCGGVHSTEG